MNKTRKPKLNKRAMIVFYMLFSATFLPFSGLFLHETTNHNSESLRFLSMGFHNVTALVFTVSTIIHVKYNWKPIVNYVKDKRENLIKYPREMAIAGSSLILLLVLMIMHMAGFHL